MKAELRTSSGDHVHSFIMPEFKVLPDVAVWGSRIFALKESFRMMKSPIYFEVCAWSVDASDALTKASKS